MRVASRAADACLLIIELDYNWDKSRNRVKFGPADAAQLPAWRTFGGRNTVLVDSSDRGTRAETARRHWGHCPIVAQSRAVRGITVWTGIDVSLPLPPRAPCCASLDGLSAGLWELDGAARRYWLTFRGTTYFKGEGLLRNTLLALNALSRPGRGQEMVVVLGCHTLHKEHLLPQNRAHCERLAAGLRAAPSYLGLLNTTFALLSAARQPATTRLNEAMAAAAIPVFVSGDTEGAYMPPFSELINWPAISVNVRWSQVPQLPGILARLTPARIAAMQRGVRSAWQQHLRPDSGATQRTFHTVITDVFSRGAHAP
jgi:hypothetical protein